MNHYILGIDTSAYTTSIAVIDQETNEIIENKRKILTVPMGQKGLRQQDAVFQHMKNFYELYYDMSIVFNNIKTVSVSSKPRNIEGSYMPVFTVGQNFGKIIAKTLNCNYLEYSHQENHIAASLLHNYKEINNNIIAIHISGGTTEFLQVSKAKKGYDAKIVGGSKDITYGQLIDRIGILLDFQFPCGLHMEKHLYDNNIIDEIKTPKISGDEYINLSGMENYYTNLYLSKKYSKESIINSLFTYIADSIVHIINKLNISSTIETIIITGGVASNSFIRKHILNNLDKNINILLPTKENATDNAIGTAFLPIIDRWYNEVKTN